MSSVRLFGGLAASLVFAIAFAQASAPGAEAGHKANAPAPPPGHYARKTSPYRNLGHSNGARLFETLNWGVDNLQVRKTSSGALIRFSYRVVDAARAKLLHEKKAEPHLIGLRSHAVLSVPTLENVGQLRQTEGLENGKDYWVLFSNKGDYVKVGDRVDVAIGDFYVSGLTVQ